MCPLLSGLDPHGVDDPLTGHPGPFARLLDQRARTRVEQAEHDVVADEVERAAEDSLRPRAGWIGRACAASRSSSSVTPGQKHLAVYSIGRDRRAQVSQSCPKGVPALGSGGR